MKSDIITIKTPIPQAAKSCLSQPNKLSLNQPPFGGLPWDWRLSASSPAEAIYFPVKERRLMNTLEARLAKARIIQPDHIFPGCWFDGKVRKEQKIRLPFRELKANNYKLYGCYVWLQPENSKGETEIMYVGRTTKLCNRLQQYWNDTTCPRFLRAWYEWAEENNEPFTPCVAIWLCENPADLEKKLIKALNPRYNIHDRGVLGNRVYFDYMGEWGSPRQVPVETEPKQLALFSRVTL